MITEYLFLYPQYRFSSQRTDQLTHKYLAKTCLSFAGIALYQVNPYSDFSVVSIELADVLVLLFIFSSLIFGFF